VTVHAWWSALALGVLCTGLAFVLYYRLIYRIGAPRAATVTYLIPLFGVMWAWLLLGESVTHTMVVACALILGGVALSQQAARK
jgi:drug/metabolite transporter (DMT)-like permease